MERRATLPGCGGECVGFASVPASHWSSENIKHKLLTVQFVRYGWGGNNMIRY